MKPEVKARWVEALRSGDYQQGTGNLHLVTSGEETFCCLGVLCDLAVREGVLPAETREWTAGNGGPVVEYRYAGSAAFLPVAVAEWAGIDTGGEVFDDANSGVDKGVEVVNPAVLHPDPEYDDAVPLADLNDGGYSFGEIADVIERSPL